MDRKSERLRRSASRLGLVNTSFFSATYEPNRSRSSGARFVVLPSLWNENAPLAGLEAMARGRPLIVSAVGGLQELAQAGRGYIALAGGVADLAERMDLLMSDDEECRRAGAAALAFARNELTPERHLGELERAYRTLIN